MNNKLKKRYRPNKWGDNFFYYLTTSTRTTASFEVAPALSLIVYENASEPLKPALGV